MSLPLNLRSCLGLLTLAVLLVSCESRYGPGDRPSSFGGIEVLSGRSLWLEDLRGKWVLVRQIDTSRQHEYSPTPRPLKLLNLLSVDNSLARENLVLLNVCRGQLLSELQTAAQRQTLDGILLRVYEEANWADLEWSQDYLIAPSGVVVMAEPAGEADWNALLPAFLTQPDDFSPARIGKSHHWSQDRSSLDIQLQLFRPGRGQVPCRLELSFDYSVPQREGQEGVPAIVKSQDFTVTAGVSGEQIVPFHYELEPGCNGASYVISLFDARVGHWISRRGGILPPEPLGTPTGGQSNAGYDSSYRVPAGPAR